MLQAPTDSAAEVRANVFSRVHGMGNGEMGTERFTGPLVGFHATLSKQVNLTEVTLWLFKQCVSACENECLGLSQRWG